VILFPLIKLSGDTKMAENKKMVSEDGYDLCTRCNKKTQYKSDTHIDVRENYIEGSGQLCEKCYEIVYCKK